MRGRQGIKRSMPRPNLFIIGAMKSGTSSLHDILSSHPQVFMCTPKEPDYFVDGLPLRAKRLVHAPFGSAEREAAYLDLFREAGNCPVIGESSTAYTKLPQFPKVAERIADYAPDARFIYVMRDPIQRTISHYWHRVRMHGEQRPLAKAIRASSHYLDCSYYAMQLRPFLERFGPERIRALTFEALLKDPTESVAALWTWLKLDPSEVPRVELPHNNETPPVVLQDRGISALSPLRKLADRDSVALPFIRGAARRIVGRPVDRKAINTVEVEQILRPIQLQQTRELSALLGRDFPEWSRLYACQENRHADLGGNGDQPSTT